MRDSMDGFVIAQKDLELRGPGELLGTRQTGLMQFKMADIVRDEALLDKATKAATHLLNTDAKTVETLVNRWFGQRLIYHEA
jgi:ATP-dependent DNA helicase RecG